MNKRIIFPLIISILLLASCNLPTKQADISSGDALRTAAAQTVSVKLTEDGSTSSDNSTTQPTQTAVVLASATTGSAATNTLPPPTVTIKPTDTCDSASYVADITIADGDEFAFGDSLTKTWEIKNTGTCTWTTSYSLIYAADVSGTADLNEPGAVALTNSVPPGGSIQVSVDLVAPSVAGTYRSDWRLQNASGISFPVDSGTIWLLIKVVDVTNTPSPTWDPSIPTHTPDPSIPTNTPVPTSTPWSISNSGGINVEQTKSMDLDTGHVTTSGADILFQFIDNNNKFLVPQSSATIVSWGGSVPGYSDCAGASLSTAKVQVTSSVVGNYYCYKTDTGRYGYFKLNTLTPSDVTQSQTLNIAYNTWSTD